MPIIDVNVSGTGLPPKFHLKLRLMMAPTHQEGVRCFITHIRKLSGQSVAGSQAGPKTARDGVWG